MRKILSYGLAFLVVLSCGTTRRSVSQTQAPVQLPLEDSTAIALSRQRAQEVLDSIDRVRNVADQPSKEWEAKAQENTEKDIPLSDQVIAYARTFLGTPYKLGASGPKQFDCSSFTSYVFRHFGYKITAFSGAQFREGREVENYSDLQKGDLVFFGKRGSVRNIGHVGIIVSVDEEKGSFTFIHASVSKGVTEETSSHPYFMMRYMGARRILPDEKH